MTNKAIILAAGVLFFGYAQGGGMGTSFGSASMFSGSPTGMFSSIGSQRMVTRAKTSILGATSIWTAS
ncbi:MAG: hypothetical protein ACRBBU_11930 [Pseudooceanicola sp.]